MSDFTFWVMVVIVGDPATIVFFLTCRKIPESTTGFKFPRQNYPVLQSNVSNLLIGI